MSKLEELIQELCPDGVKYYELKEIADISTGSHNTNEGVEDGIYPFYVRSPEPLTLNSYDYEETAIITAGDGVGVGKVFHFVNGKYALHQRAYRIHVNTTKVDDKFLYYYFCANFMNYIEKTMFKGSVPSIRRPMLNAFKIPVPPLEVQKEIVRLLDDFTAKTAELQAKLNKEYEARKKQYEYYRNLLLNANKSNTVMKLGDVADVGVGNKPVEILNDSTDYEYINAGTTNSGYTHEWNCSGDTVTTPSRGQGGIGFVGYQSNSFWLGPLCYKIKSNKDWVTTKYLYYILSNSTEELLSLKKTGGVPALNRSDLIQMKISIPSLEEQNHIVDILDQFDSTYNNLKITLPTEIESRQKQYEFYRDKLLTFKELN